MKYLLRTIQSVVFISLSFFIYGQASNKIESPIDKTYESCRGENQTTQGMIECAQNAQKLWDVELNKSYKQLMTLLSPDEKEKLKKAQISWLAFRDSEFSFSGTAYYNLQGTMWLVTAADRAMSVVRTRAQELKTYVAILKDNK